MNQGTALLARAAAATASSGFAAGLLPPTFGCEWHEAHWLELKRGPSPLPSFAVAPLTTSTVLNRARPSWKNANSAAPSPGIGSGVVLSVAVRRTPGSTACATAVVVYAQAAASRLNLQTQGMTCWKFMIVPSRCCEQSTCIDCASGGGLRVSQDVVEVTQSRDVAVARQSAARIAAGRLAPGLIRVDISTLFHDGGARRNAESARPSDP